jgi:hypothetical protein
MSLYSPATARAVALLTTPTAAVSVTPLTYAVWVKMAVAPVSTIETVMQFDSNTAGAASSQLTRIYNAGGAVSDPYRASFNAGGSNMVMPGTDTAFSSGVDVWDHLAVVITSASIRDFYLNGVAVTRVTNTRDVTGLARIQLMGAASTAAENVTSAVNGYISHPAMWASALSAAQILELQAALPTAVSTPAYYWATGGGSLATAKVGTVGGVDLTEFGSGLAYSADEPSIGSSSSTIAPLAASYYRMANA